LPELDLDDWPTWLLAPGGATLAERRSRVIRLYDTRTGKRLLEDNSHSQVPAWTFTANGRTLATAGPDCILRFWDANTGRSLRRLDLPKKKTSRIDWICFTADGSEFAIGVEREISFWQTATGKQKYRVPMSKGYWGFGNIPDVPGAAFTPNGRYLFVPSLHHEFLWIWNTDSRREVEQFQEDEYQGRRGGVPSCSKVAVSGDGRLLARFDCDMNLRLHEIATGQIIHRFDEDCAALAFSSSGWRLATSCKDDCSILIWDLPTLFRSAPLPRASLKPEPLWTALSSTSAMDAHRALWRLAALPEADAYLSRELRPVESLPAGRLRTLIADLGSADFHTRQQAEHALIAAREAAREALVGAHRKPSDVEQRLRVQRLLDRLQPRAAERLREARAVMVLEARATPAARKLLARLAGGVPGARLTEEARVALERLDGKHAKR
jgi:WD40 repeat protein